MVKFLLSYIMVLFSMTAQGMESTKPRQPITTPTLAMSVLKYLSKNSHPKVIGTCFWQEGTLPPKITPGPALSQFIPDLVVTVSNNPGENPWIEANQLFENKPALQVYQSAFTRIMGMPLGFGDGSGQLASQHINEDRTRVVSVIGSPGNVYKIKGLTHRSETTFMKLYYSSLADAVSDRTTGELLYMATHPYLLIGHKIGTTFNHWGHEFPRLMRVTQPSRFRASVVAAMHAADIVTNNGMHLKQSTSNRCGPNCIVSNVIFDSKQKHLIWQEVYPNNRNIIPGKDSDKGEVDDAKGNGNYVFVVWRQYKGCVKQKGKLLWGFPQVGKPKKR
jgi:integrating conjugative element protein (TIGR03756 family)